MIEVVRYNINYIFIIVLGDHYIHLYWSDVPLDFSPLLAYCPGPILPVDHTKVKVTGTGATQARSQVMAEFMIDGKLAGPGNYGVYIMYSSSRLHTLSSFHVGLQ